jgi:hypothetical protein
LSGRDSRESLVSSDVEGQSDGRRERSFSASLLTSMLDGICQFLASGNPADLGIDKLIKTFEPLKADDDNAFGSADGKSVDGHIVGDVAYFSYDSFGLGAYRMADLIAPPTDINPLCTDPTKLSAKQGGPAECRPPVGWLLQAAEGHVGSQLCHAGRRRPAALPHAAVANPKLMAIKGVVGGAVGTAINNGRVYVPAGVQAA